MEWAVLGLIPDNIAIYLVGSTLAAALLLMIMFIVLLVSNGVNFKSAFLFSMPIMAAFSANAYLGSGNWVFNIILMIVGLFYAYALIKLTT